MRPSGIPLSERRKAARLADPEKYRERARRDYEKNKERRSAQKKEYQKRNRKAISAKKMEWARANPDKVAAMRSSYHERNKEKLRNARLCREFGITVERYDQMFLEQGGVCAICGGADSDRRLAVDHCHTTNKVRSLLCSNCNLAIGKLRDDPDLVDRAAEYLRRHRGEV